MMKIIMLNCVEFSMRRRVQSGAAFAPASLVGRRSASALASARLGSARLGDFYLSDG